MVRKNNCVLKPSEQVETDRRKIINALKPRELIEKIEEKGIMYSNYVNIMKIEEKLLIT